MSALAEPTELDWPLHRLLDEAWLRARRLAIQELTRLGFWMDEPDFRHFLAAQRACGERLRSDWLARALGDDDSVLRSQRIFRGARLRVQRALPLALAFGHELGFQFCALMDVEVDRCRRSGTLCAAFNLGVSLFDVVIDQTPDLETTLTRYISGNTLQRLCFQPTASLELKGLCSTVEDDEIRILLKIIAGFFGDLHQIAAYSRDDRLSRDLIALLEQAYAAELQSVSGRSGSLEDTLAASRAKSILPCRIMGAIARLCATGSDRRTADLADELAGELGAVLWLLDDLADMCRDLRVSSPNSLLAESGIAPQMKSDSAAVHRRVCDLLNGTHIEQTVTRIGGHLLSVDALLAGNGSRTGSVLDLRRCVRGYVRSWLT